MACTDLWDKGKLHMLVGGVRVRVQRVAAETTNARAWARESQQAQRVGGAQTLSITGGEGVARQAATKCTRATAGQGKTSWGQTQNASHCQGKLVPGLVA